MTKFTTTYWFGWMWIGIGLASLLIWHNDTAFYVQLATAAILFEINNVRVDIRKSAPRPVDARTILNAIDLAQKVKR